MAYDKYALVRLALMLSVLPVSTYLPLSSPVQAQSPKSFVAHSRDYPGHGFWPGLDATVTETQRDGRLSILSIIERKGPRGYAAGARFLWCVSYWLADERGFANFKVSTPIDYVDSPPTQDKDMEYVFAIVLLESPDEDVDKLLGIQKDKYKPFRNIAAPREFLKATCGKYRS